MVDEAREDQGPDHVGVVDRGEGFGFYSGSSGGHGRELGRE